MDNLLNEHFCKLIKFRFGEILGEIMLNDETQLNLGLTISVSYKGSRTHICTDMGVMLSRYV